MTTVYLSSTYSDLKTHREVVYHSLRQMRYDVIAMEDYVATDQRPLKKCLADVATCDLYIGFFAWRYGYIPSTVDENPEHKSITELEYRQAIQMGKICLIFLLAEDAPWPPVLMDVVTGEGHRGEYIAALRSELAQEKIVSFFKTPEQLASLVGSAVHLWENSQSGLHYAISSTLVHTNNLGMSERKARLKAMLADHSGFICDRLESFVGRQAELAEIRRRIGEKLETGGFVTITGQAGQGKSSIIAKLVEEYGVENIAFHFIPFNPGPDHQVGLLRNLMARLILKYDLTDLFVASENRATLKDYFPKVLAEIVEKGGQEVIFIDGLDQLEEDFSGVRDLSFLPNNPPSGIVFVLGTRPNDTLKPLELLKPRDEYELPSLSRQDFDLILSRRQVPLERELADQFYQAMQENALYLDLVAKELQEKGASSPRKMITRIANNPENIFSLSMTRLKRQPVEWREVLKPILGVLLVAREPLSLWQIRHILQLEDDRLRDAIARLGGLIAETGQRQYILFHLKLRDYLRQDEHSPQKEYIFAADEEEQWHAILAAWCEKGQIALIWKDVKDPVEQARREYARQHYLAHLFHAQKWQKLFAILDEGTYGQAKERQDLSTRSYIQDLDMGRRAAAWNGWRIEEGVEFLPYLWRYTLLRCSLRSRADKYPLAIFQLLLLFNRESEVLGLAELLTNPLYKVQVLLQTARHLSNLTMHSSESSQIFLRALEVARSIENKVQRAIALREVAIALTKAQRWEQAEAVARSIEDSVRRAYVLRGLVIALTKAQHLEEAERVWIEAEAVARSIEDVTQRATTLIELSTALSETQRWEQAKIVCTEAERTLLSNESSSSRVNALSRLAIALAELQRWEQAEAVARSIDDSIQRAIALSGVATILTKAQQWEVAERVWMEAEAVVKLIEDSMQRTSALNRLAIALVEVKRWEQAEKVARLIEDCIQRASALSRVAITLVKAQQWEEAEKIWKEAEALARSLEDNVQQTKALKELAIARAKAQQWEQAESLARSLEDNVEQEIALRELAIAHAKAQQWEQAKALASSLENNTQRAIASCELAIALTKARQWEQAEAVARSIEDNVQRTIALHGLSLALAKTQQPEQAEVVARSIANSVQQASALGRVAIAFTVTQQWEEAERVWMEAEALARSLKNRVQLASALQEVAISFAKARRWEKAEALASSIEDDTRRAETLRAFSEIILRINEEELLLWLVQRAWLLAETREYAFQLFDLALGLVPLKHEIGGELFKAFSWVDSFVGGFDSRD